MEAIHPRNPLPRDLLLCASWACAAAVATREFGLPGLAGMLCLVYLDCLRAGRGTVAVIALPCALGALQIPSAQSEALLAPGLVQIQAEVMPGIRTDTIGSGRIVPIRIDGREFLLALAGSMPLLPGDRLSGLAFLPDQRTRRRDQRVPLLRAEAGALRHSSGGWSPRRLAEACRQALQASLLALVDGEEGILVCHLVLGRGPPLPPDLISAHRATGLTHLLAVSGAHASMLALMMGILFRMFTGRAPWGSRGYRRFCAIMLLSYGAITGWEPPVFRALAAYGLMLLAAARGRRLPLHSCLAFPALLTAILQPEELFGPSFCLSYAAVIGISLAGAFDGVGVWNHWLKVPLRASFWAVLLTAPFSLYYFGQIAPWTLIATPLLSPIVAAMLGLGVCTAIIGLLAPALAALPAAVLALLTWTYNGLVRSFTLLPGAPVFAPSSPDPWLLVGAGVIALLVLGAWPNRRGIAIACLWFCLPHFLPSPAPVAPGLRLFAVGHGQACLLTFMDRRQVLVDCGNLGNPQRSGRLVARSLRRRSIDLLIISHGDQDHSGGLRALCERIPITRAILPAAMRDGSVSRLLRDAGTGLLFMPPGTTHREHDLMVFAPDPDQASDNDRSLWVHARLGPLTCLLSGDAQAAGIAAFLESGAELEADVLLLPHHGRGEEAAGRILLEQIRPQLALVSNRASETSTELGQLARSLGITVLATGNRGEIEVIAGDAPRVECQYPRSIGSSR